jgi:hypothetical protein
MYKMNIAVIDRCVCVCVCGCVGAWVRGCVGDRLVWVVGGWKDGVKNVEVCGVL